MPYLTSKTVRVVVCLIALLTLVLPVQATRIGDLVRVHGAESSKIVGMGLVFGLTGTGDGGRFLPSMRQLAEIIGTLGDPNVVADELRNANNVAMVYLEAIVPENGISRGDPLDVRVAAAGPASSLVGGRLFMVPMVGPRRDVVTEPLAFASGMVTVEDIENPATGIIYDGAIAAVTLSPQYMDRQGRVTLIINPEHASFQLANNIANVISGLVSPDGDPVAHPLNAKTIIIQVPPSERSNIVRFLSPILDTHIDRDFIAPGALVVVNEKTGTIVFTDEVEISPAGISHGGMSIQRITPEPIPNPAQPLIEQQHVLALDPSDRPNPKLADLVEAFNQLKVPAADRIAIIRTLEKAKRLHAKVVYE
ncbi:flagellar basal body P-ring protein FlgI [Mucisphaera calidilacus]|uniref:Flagellar P-ring protein n=1 Tax=Mucisphaera calidilacus TaxID=2527982 RepID=A0A518BZH1_9BACT|nr:flagellar basal body P-ring protein FlgI [Mucisphaera calidilacus]QDU72365.1 Flagellar P-ring protein precursor [Mucisphaera calidilacus]